MPRVYPFGFIHVEFKYFYKRNIGEHVDCHPAFILVSGCLTGVSLKKTYVDVACLKSFVSSEVRDSFQSARLLKCNRSGSMTQGEKENLAERRREMQVRRDERDALEKSYLELVTSVIRWVNFP
jgi:hypothetical protein